MRTDTENQSTDTDTETTNPGTETAKAAKAKKDAGRRSYFMFDPTKDLTVIGLDTEDGPEHALYDVRIKLPLDEQLVRNIMHYGIIKPIHFTRDGERNLVVDGRRRVLHAREAAKRQLAQGLEVVKVPALPKQGEDSYLFGVSRAANALAVTDGPLTNAKNAQRMLDMGASEDEIAIAFGVKAQTVKDWTTLLGLAPKVRNAVEKGVLTASAAGHLGTLAKEEQEKHLDEILAQGGKAKTTEEVLTRVRAAKGKPAVNTPKVRVTKATEALTKFMSVGAITKATKDELIDILQRVSKAITGKALEKLVVEDEADEK